VESSEKKDLKCSGFKISELEMLAREHEWKGNYAECSSAY
jgi:hypothetical protein